MRTQLEPQPPSLTTILEGIGREILPAAKKKVRKAYSGEGLGLSSLFARTLDIDTGPLWPLSQMESKNQGRQGLLKPLWWILTPADTAVGRPCSGPMNAEVDPRGPGLSQAESPSGSQSSRSSCRAGRAKEPRGQCAREDGAVEGCRA